jgi:Zn-dependent alcohol dehydrogenase
MSATERIDPSPQCSPHNPSCPHSGVGDFGRHMACFLMTDWGVHWVSLQYGPVMCAGVTTYEPLWVNNAKSGSRVGIVGLGGLGQMGVKIAKARGRGVIERSSRSTNNRWTQSARTHKRSTSRQVVLQFWSSACSQ